MFGLEILKEYRLCFKVKNRSPAPPKNKKRFPMDIEKGIPKAIIPK
jgi:hypothetical protein